MMLYKTMAIYGRTMKHYELGVHATIKNQVLLMNRNRRLVATDDYWNKHGPMVFRLAKNILDCSLVT